MNKLLSALLFFFALYFSYAQHSDSLKVNTNRMTIDSITALQWNENTINIEDATQFKIVKIPTVATDTTIVEEKNVISTVAEPIPITPYHIMNSPSEQRWYIYGENSLMMNQAAYSNWNAGGANNIGLNAKVNYSFIYKNRRHYIDNNLQLRYGMVATKGQASKKTDDYIQFYSNYGYDLKNNFYLSAGLRLTTQFSYGYNYKNTPDPEASDRVSSFMAPGYLDVGLGISYNPSENLQIIFRPATGRFTFVLDPDLQKAGNYGLEHDGQNLRTEFGALLNISYQLDITEGLSYTSRLNLFSNYSNHPERVDLTYDGSLNIRFNKYIKTNVSVNLIYDHDQLQRLQLRETLGVGFSYNFGARSKEKPSEKKLIDPFSKKVM